jgi:hypothetical protein
MTASTTSSNRPWGRIFAILSGSYVTVLGLIAQLDPEILLLRIVLISTVAGLLARVVAEIIVPLMQTDI